MTTAKREDCIQILIYIRRKRDLTPEQFYNHWEDVHAHKVIPWAEKHGMIRYQQIHVSGAMIPVQEAYRNDDIPTSPVEFDGIAMFLVPSLDKFTEAFIDPYYIEVIEPDEREMIDKDGPGNGIVANIHGKMVDITLQGKSVVGDKGKSLEYRELFEEYQKRKTF